jgi:hypothetical protein
MMDYGPFSEDGYVDAPSRFKNCHDCGAPHVRGRQPMTEWDGTFAMDPESNWDICPVCSPWLAEQDDFPGRDAMRARHEEHKRFAPPVGRHADG